MDDLISRQAALNSPVTMVSEGLDWIPAYHVKSLPSAQPEQRWIPCEERMPEDDTPVLVYLFEHNKNPYIAWLSDCRWYTEDFEVEKEHYPTAWMPLPEPYEMDEEAQDENND